MKISLLSLLSAAGVAIASVTSSVKAPQIEVKSNIINAINGLAIDGNIVINGETNTLLINSINAESANYTLQSISGVFKNVKNDKKVKDAPKVSNIGKTIQGDSNTTPYAYNFPSEFKTGDLKLEVSLTVSDNEGISHLLDAFDGVLTVVEPKQTFDLEMLSIYALLAGIAYLAAKFVYETYINPLSPAEKKRKSKAKENISAPIRPVNVEDVKEGDNDWMPELAKLKQRKNKSASSAEETSGDEAGKKAKKGKKGGLDLSARYLGASWHMIVFTSENSLTFKKCTLASNTKIAILHRLYLLTVSTDRHHQEIMEGAVHVRVAYSLLTLLRGPPLPPPYGYPSPRPHPAHGFHGPPQPPSGMQHVSTPGGGNVEFRYSQATGKRKALLIGINYFNTKSELRGCINDVQNMQRFLLHRGYKPEDMVILTDDQRNPMSHPTRANITRAIGWLVSNAQPNDSLFWHYSGHGGQAKDRVGDEADGYDETILPVDYKMAGQIIDDELYDRMVRPLQPGVRLTAIFDSCHSATALDLPYLYSTKGSVKEQNGLEGAGTNLLNAGMSYMRGNTGSAVKTLFGLGKSAIRGNKAQKLSMQKTHPADVISLSGCKDNQTSADTSFGNMNGGAMSHAFCSVVSKYSNLSYLDLLNAIRDEISRYQQLPQLSSAHPIDLNLKFVV
ncbi:hypothetical protein E3P96_02290 [Wallemia ichthyophaga]|nr:hypothetical protein E3P96_02290 [Wallemia ichthyophaga]